MIDSKFSEILDRNEKFNFFFLLVFFLSLILSLLIFLTLSGYLSNLEQIENVSKLISFNFILIIILILVSVKKIKENFSQEKL